MADSLGGRIRGNSMVFSQTPETPGDGGQNKWIFVSENPNGAVEGNVGDRAFLLGGAAQWVCSGDTTWINTASEPPTQAGQSMSTMIVYDPSGDTSIRSVGSHNLGVTIPANCVVTETFYEIEDSLQSADDTATLAFGIAVDDANGLVTAIAIDDVKEPWTNGANPIRNRNNDASGNQPVQFSSITTAERQFQVAVGVQPVTSGVIRFYVKYTLLGS